MFYGLTICDGDGCGAAAGAVERRMIALGRFSGASEAAGDALAAMAAGGWRVGADGSTLCPQCAERNAATLPAGEATRRVLALMSASAA